MYTKYTQELSNQADQDPKENEDGIRDLFWSNKNIDVMSDLEHSLSESELDILLETDQHIESILFQRIENKNLNYGDERRIEYCNLPELILYVENVRHYGF